MATRPASPGKPPVEKLDPKVVKIALILIVGAMAVIFDTTIVSVALHTLALKLGTSVATIQWVTTGYLLALAIAVPLSAWGLQRFGGKLLWMFALAVFLIGSIGSSLAWNVGSLIGWRFVQGIGGGLMLPLLATLIFQAAGGKSLGRLVTYVALPALLGPILGPVIGGAILTHLSWRFMFWVNVPFCVAGLLLAWWYLSDDAPGQAKGTAAAPKAKLDVPGLLLIAPGTSVLLYGLANAGTSAGFGRPDVIIPLVTGAALLAAFTWYALRKARPLVEIRLLAKRSVASSSAALFFSGFSLYGAMLLLPLFYQDVRGTTALTAGIMLVPHRRREQHRQVRLARHRPGRLRHRRRRDRAIRLRRAAYQLLAARPLDGHPGVRPRRRHHAPDGRRLRRPGQGADPSLQRADAHRPADRRLVRHRRPRGDPHRCHRRAPRIAR
jgi:EmrB/QacA subfamily drug resistance transporter